MKQDPDLTEDPDLLEDHDLALITCPKCDENAVERIGNHLRCVLCDPITHDEALNEMDLLKGTIEALRGELTRTRRMFIDAHNRQTAEIMTLREKLDILSDYATHQSGICGEECRCGLNRLLNTELNTELNTK